MQWHYLMWTDDLHPVDSMLHCFSCSSVALRTCIYSHFLMLLPHIYFQSKPQWKLPSICDFAFWCHKSRRLKAPTILFIIMYKINIMVLENIRNNRILIKSSTQNCQDIWHIRHSIKTLKINVLKEKVLGKFDWFSLLILEVI